MKSIINKSVIAFYLVIFSFTYLISQNIASGSLGNKEEADNQKTSEINQTSDTNVAAKIVNYVITRQEVEKRLLLEYKPDPYTIYPENKKPYDANKMLLVMLGEKAVAMEARKQGLLEEDTIQKVVTNERRKRIINLWIQYNINKERDKIIATEEEIETQMKADSKMDRQKAKSTVETAKANKIIDQCYKNLYKNSEVKKITDNFPKAIEIHDRLLNHPVKKRPSNFIRDYQIQDELTDEEKNLVLATFTNGKVTLYDWLDVLCDYSPPSRPKNLNTAEGIEQLLERTLTKPLIIADAHELKLDNDPAFLKQIEDYENEQLLNNIKNTKNGDVNEPTSEEILDFYKNNGECFMLNRSLAIDQIWCKNLETAQLVKKELDNGKEFDNLKKEYSLYPNSIPFQTSQGEEGYFWDEIWPSEPNEIKGPVKGYRTEGIKWRIVKIYEKNPGNTQEYSKELETTVKYLMISEIAKKQFADYCLENLKKYPYDIYSDNIKDIDPMNIQ